MLDELEAEVSGERPAFLTKNPKMSLDDIEAEVAASPKKADSRPLKNTGPIEDIRAELAAATKQNQAPTRLDAAYAGARKAASFGFSDELEGATNRALDLATGRGLSTSDVVAGKKAPTYSTYRDAARERDNAATSAHPWAALGGETAGGLATSIVPGLGPSLKAGAGWRAAAEAGAKQGGLFGLGNSEADLTKGDLAGALRDTATGATAGAVTGGIVGKAVRGAPERVDDRALRSINLGDDTNSKLSTARKVMAKAGEEGKDLLEMLDETPAMKKILANKAASDPRAAEKFVGKRLDHLTDQTEPFYKAIDNAPDRRFTIPENATKDTRPRMGGVDIGDLDARLEKAGAGFVAEGKALMASAVEKARANLARLYGTEMEDGAKKIIPGTVLPSRAVRNYANEVGEIAFAGDPTVSPKALARGRQALYREIVDSIADAGAKGGVDVGKLKSLNKEISTLIPVRQALTERAVQKEAGRSSLSETIKKAAVPALAGAAGLAHSPGAGLGTLAAGAAGYGLAKASKPLARAADWQVARLVRAARGGSPAAQLGQLAIEMGLSRVVGEEIGKRVNGE